MALPPPSRFPSEIRLKILREILVCPDRLSFTPIPATRKDAVGAHPLVRRFHLLTQSSRILRLCRWNQCSHNEPEAFALFANFKALCLVSKTLRAEARTVFFGQNAWVLHGAQKFNFDAIHWVLKYWGEETLLEMRNVRIELQSTHLDDTFLAYKSLVSFVRVMKGQGRLRELVSLRFLE